MLRQLPTGVRECEERYKKSPQKPKNDLEVSHLESKILGVEQEAFSVTQKIDEALIRLRSCGYRIHRDCRFEAYKRRYTEYYLKKIFYQDYKSDEIREQEILQGYKDYWELLYISGSQGVLRNNNKQVLSEIQRIFDGELIESTLDSAPWNYQFQYYLSSIFEYSGFKTYLMEPDFIFEYKGKKYSVAVKRISSKNEIGNNIRKAEKQISKTDNYGFIALSLDKIYKFIGDVHTFTDPDKSVRVAEEIIQHIIKDYLKWNHFFDRTSQILGIIAHLSYPFIYKSSKPIYELGYSSYTMFLPIGPPDSPQWNEVVEIGSRLKSINIKTML